MAIKVSFKALRGLLGKEVEDPAVKALLAKAGKVTIKPEFIIAKEAGFDFAIDRPEGAKKKQLTCLFLYPEGRDKHLGFVDLPPGFTFTTRADLLAALPAPAVTWKMGKGKVAVTHKSPDSDQWAIEGYDYSADYREGDVRGFQITASEDAGKGRDLGTNPLHFETKPVDAPKQAGLMGMALLVAWSADRFGLPAKHRDSAPGKQLVKRAITPLAFYTQAIGKGLSSVDVDPKLEDFLWGYTHRMFLSTDDGAREKLDAKLHAILRLEAADKTDDERAYSDDYLGTFSDLESPYYVPDSWAAVDRIAPILDARWADYEATGFETNPDVKRYEKAAKLRDAVKLAPATAAVTAATADESLASDLVACIGKQLADAKVRAILERAGVPVSKRVEPQANPKLGVEYMAVNEKFDGKPKLVVDSVRFYAAKRTSYVRTLKAEVQFLQFPGLLPYKLAFGMARPAVAKLLGTPKTYDEDDHFVMSKKLRILCTFAKGKLVEVYFGKPLGKS